MYTPIRRDSAFLDYVYEVVDCYSTNNCLTLYRAFYCVNAISAT